MNKTQSDDFRRTGGCPADPEEKLFEPADLKAAASYLNSFAT